MTPVDYSGVKARIIASVSSDNEELYHQFRKNAKLFETKLSASLDILRINMRLAVKKY